MVLVPYGKTCFCSQAFRPLNRVTNPLLFLPSNSPGDCCECTCVDGPDYSCDVGFSCIDPNSGCVAPVLAEYPNCTGYLSEMGNGYCNKENNNNLCGYDLGEITLTLYII